MLDYLKDKRILIVDDEANILELIESILRSEGFHNLYTASNMKEALNQAEKHKPELAILDVMLPDGNGYLLMEHLKDFGDFPMLFLTALDKSENKYKGLELGADDYIVKPFLPKELVLRIKAILRRCYKSDNPVINLEGSSINFEKAEVYKSGEIIPLTAKEHELLSVLHRNNSRIVTIDTLCQAAWGDNPFGYENSLMAHIRRIREKIELSPSKPVSLLTVRGLGYKLVLKDGK